MFLNFSFCHKTENCNPKIDLTNLTRWALSQYLKTKLEYDFDSDSREMMTMMMMIAFI